LASAEQRREFTAAFVDKFDEESLNEHDAELVRLQQVLQLCQPLLELKAKRDDCLQKLQASNCPALPSCSLSTGLTMALAEME
jgi:hypothetical protein